MKLLTKSNKLTSYALACGYVERIHINENKAILFKKHSTFFIRALIDGESNSFAFNKLNEARAFFARLIRGMK